MPRGDCIKQENNQTTSISALFSSELIQIQYSNWKVHKSQEWNLVNFCKVNPTMQPKLRSLETEYYQHHIKVTKSLQGPSEE